MYIYMVLVSNIRFVTFHTKYKLNSLLTLLLEKNPMLDLLRGWNNEYGVRLTYKIK